MDLIEFTERYLGVEFTEYQKDYIRKLDEKGRNNMTENKAYLISDKKYIEVDREAKVGDKIVIVDANLTGGSYQNGDVLAVTSLNRGTGVRCEEIANKENYGGQVDKEEYRVLTPAEPTPDIHDLIANLAQRVTSLERITGELVRAKSSVESQLLDAQRNIERQAQELEGLKDEVESNTKDIAFLDERTYEKPGKPTNSDAVFPEIKTYKLSDLDGKELRIYSSTDFDVTVTMGIDVNDGHMYVLENGGAGA